MMCPKLITNIKCKVYQEVGDNITQFINILARVSIHSYAIARPSFSLSVTRVD